MKLTKYAHACVALEKDGARIVLDPGTFTADGAEVIAGAAAVLITHEHFDHVDEALLTAALEAQPELLVFGPAAISAKLADHDGRVRVVQPGEHFTVAGFEVAVFGGQHAAIHEDIPLVDNVGYLIDDAVYHPGDAYFAPGVPVDLLLLPTSGPWTKLGEAVQFVRAVAPQRLVQIHELMLSELGQRSTAAILGENGLTGLPLTLLAPKETIEV